jgi:hypothetical protein
MVSAIMQGGSPCENAPGLRFDTFNVEIAAMFAPKPMLLVSATGDWTKNVPKEEYQEIRKIYQLHGKPENVEVVQIDAPHNYNKESREAVYRFFGKQILGETDATKFKERNVPIESAPNLLVWYGRPMPANALTYDKLFAQWKAASEVQQMDGVPDQRMLLALGVEFPPRVMSDPAIAADPPAAPRRKKAPAAPIEQKIALGREGRGDRIPAIWIPGEGAPALVVHQDGAEAGRKSDVVAGLLKARRPVLLIDAFQTGAAKGMRDEKERHFLAFNRTDSQNRVQDVLTAISFLALMGKGPVEIHGVGDGALWATFAVGIAPPRLKVKLATPVKDFTGTDEEFIQRFFVPGIQRAGGWSLAKQMVAARAATN